MVTEIARQPGRNDPCPCGSGKKFKKCCGGQAAPMRTVHPASGPATRSALQAAVELHKSGRSHEAEVAYRQILKVESGNVDALHLLGLLKQQQGDHAQAIDLLKRALAFDPERAGAYNNLGESLRLIGRMDEALACYQQALTLNPQSAAANNNLGNVLKDLKRFDEAATCYRQALALNPNHAMAMSNLATTYVELGQLDVALDCYRKAIAIDPDFVMAYDGFFMSSQYRAGGVPDDLATMYRRFAERFEAPLRASGSRHEPPADSRRPLRIGFVSGDLHSHPVGYFIENVLANLDRTQLHVTLYSNYHEIDDLTRSLHRLADAWRPIQGLADDAAAQLIRDDRIDILVDLSGHTARNRLLVFARKPAPVQVTWLGFFATTGLHAIDYILCDRHVLPVGDEGCFTERPWRLPDGYLCFTPPHDDIAAGPLPASRDGFITFGCFNNVTKLNTEVIALWSRVLLAVPNARLLLKARQLDQEAVAQRMRSRFAAHGIEPGRLSCEGYSPRDQYLASYNRIDIALDPFPFPGGTTTAEALWMGVPVLGKRGDRFISHAAASILNNAGLAGWIAEDDDDYVARAIRHAGDIELLAALRASLRERMVASPFCDAPRFARHLEAAFVGMWRQHCGHIGQ